MDRAERRKNCRGNQKKALLSGLRYFFLFSASLLLASQEGGHGAEHTLQLLGKTFNFLLLFGILAYILYRPLKNFLASYAEKERKTLEDAERQREEAEARLSEIERRLANIDQEIGKIKEEARAQGEREKERIIRQAEEERERLMKLAKEEIDSMYENAVKQLREYAAELSVKIAEQKIKAELDQEKHRKLIEYYIKELEKEGK